MRPLDGLVHGKGKTEIVGCDDQLSDLTHKGPQIAECEAAPVTPYFTGLVVGGTGLEPVTPAM